jgi:hypothetical protein
MFMKNFCWTVVTALGVLVCVVSATQAGLSAPSNVAAATTIAPVPTVEFYGPLASQNNPPRIGPPSPSKAADAHAVTSPVHIPGLYAFVFLAGGLIVLAFGALHRPQHNRPAVSHP